MPQTLNDLVENPLFTRDDGEPHRHAIESPPSRRPYRKERLRRGSSRPFLWELADVKLNERLVFGRTFERLGQEHGIEILLAYKQISEKTKDSFDAIRETRRKYLHVWSEDHDSISGDAKKVFHETVSVAQIAIGAHGFEDGMVIISDKSAE